MLQKHCISLILKLLPYRCVWPLSLLAYKATAKALSLPRRRPLEFTEQQDGGDMGDLAYCYRLHVKPKKRHEIDNLARVSYHLKDYRGDKFPQITFLNFLSVDR